MRIRDKRRGLPQLWLLLLAALVPAGHCAATDGQACLAAGVQPTYPPINSPPNVQTTTQVANGSSILSGAECFGEQAKPALWISVASIVSASLSQTQLIERFGAISQLSEVQYWSTMDQSWRALVSMAFAVEGRDIENPRGDYSVAELATGAYRYFRVMDTRSAHAIEYRLQLRPSPPGHLSIETANVEPIKEWGVTLYEPEGVKTFYFLNERSPGVWSYYSITRVLPASFLARGHEKSYINRAVALFRHYMQLSGRGEVPPAP